MTVLLGGGAGVQRIRRVSEERREIFFLRKAAQGGGIARVHALRLAPARIASKKLKGIRPKE